jgi:hypothetical protein
MKFIINFIFLFIIIFLIACVYSNSKIKKYLVKKKPKIPEPLEWGVPQVPEMAYDVYPGVEWHTLTQIYNEILPGQDIAQIEANVGRILPMNAVLQATLLPTLTAEANKIKDK